MKNQIDIPLFANTLSDVHCVQANLKMILKHYFPERKYPLKYLSKVTHQYPDGWTWDISMFNFLLQLGFELKIIDDFDYESFAKRGIPFLKEIWSKDNFLIQAINSDLDFEWRSCIDFINSRRLRCIEHRSAKQRDIERLYDEGYLVSVNVNAYALDFEEGYAQHYVLITGYTKKYVQFNDCGLPAIKNRRIGWNRFHESRKNNEKMFAVKYRHSN